MDTASESANVGQVVPQANAACEGSDAGPALLGAEFVASLYRDSEAERFELTMAEFAAALEEVGRKCSFGADPDAEPEPSQREAFCRSLRLRELALARACALGREAAWTQFMTEFRAPLLHAAIAITRSSSLGEELSDSLYSELFGLSQRDGRRWSPLATYSGRGSLMGWLRAMLAQRHVNHYRRTHRETPLEDVEPVTAGGSPEVAPIPPSQLSDAVSDVLGALDTDERFLLSAYYLDRRTLLELGRVLRVHEATVSRKLKRLTEDVRKRLLKALERRGMSRRAAQEALGTDPGELDVNLRMLLQVPQDPAFIKKEGEK